MRVEIPVSAITSEPVYEKRENCALVGVRLQKPAQFIHEMITDGLSALQHRGQEGAGLAYVNGGITIEKELGLVEAALPGARIKEFPEAQTAAGHTRYSTSGNRNNREEQLQNTQPFSFKMNQEGGSLFEFSIAHNGTVRWPGNPARNEPDSDTYWLGKMIAQGPKSFKENAIQVLSTLDGAYMLLFITSENKLYVACDPWGFKPGVIGYINRGGIRGTLFASETVGIEKMGGKVIGNIPRGVFAEIKPTAEFDTGLWRIWTDPRAKVLPSAACSFERAYFADQTSIMHSSGLTNHSVRMEYGRRHAELSKPQGDQVTPVPKSGISYADGVAEQLGLPVVHAIHENRYLGRTFIEPNTPAGRKKRAFLKFRFIPELIRGKEIILVDDSIVRGNTTSGLILILFEHGAKRIELLSGIPPITHPCFWGIDFPTPEELIYRQLESEDDLRAYEEKLARWLVGNDPNFINRIKISFQTLEDYVSITQNVPYGTPPEKSGGCFHCVSGVVPKGVSTVYSS